MRISTNRPRCLEIPFRIMHDFLHLFVSNIIPFLDSIRDRQGFYVFALLGFRSGLLILLGLRFVSASLLWGEYLFKIS